jgi:hypothetical protein
MPNITDYSDLKGLDEGEWRIWIAGRLEQINNRLDETNGKVRSIPEMKLCVGNHGKQITGLWIGVSTIGFAIVVALLKYVFSL